MQIHDLVQGTPEWHAFRKEHLPASDLPAAAGVSKYVKRSDLMHEYSTGESEEITPALQALFDRGHRAEAKARIIIEEEKGVMLTSPTVSDVFRDLHLSASLDGYCFEDNFIFEHKLYNAKLAQSMWDAAMEGDVYRIEEHYLLQIQQQLLITGADYCLFVTSDGTKDKWEEVVIKPDQDIQERILDIWEMFTRNVVEYDSSKYATAKPASASIMELPVLNVEAKGSISNDNLAHYHKIGMEFAKNINTELTTDQDYADAEAMVKFCTDAEKSLGAVKANVIAQIDGLSQCFDIIDEVSGELRGKRLSLNKQVKSKKDQIKVDLIAEYVEKVGGYEDRLTSVIKGKRSVKSMRDALDIEVGKILSEGKVLTPKGEFIEALGEWSVEHKITLAALQELEDILDKYVEVKS